MVNILHPRQNGFHQQLSILIIMSHQNIHHRFERLQNTKIGEKIGGKNGGKIGGEINHFSGKSE